MNSIFPLKVFHTDNYSFHYIKKGNIGTPLVLIHGSLCDSRYWRFQLNELSKIFQVYALSLKYHWPDSWRDGCLFSIDEHVAYVSCFIEKVVKTQVHLLGHSRGGCIALEIANKHPELLYSAILCEPSINFSCKNQSIPNFYKRIFELLYQNRIEESLELFIDQTNGSKIWNKLALWFKTMIRENSSTLLPQLTEMKSNIPNDRISRLELPTLLIGGQLSPNPYPIILDRLQVLLQNSERFNIPQASHGMNLNNSKFFNSILFQFLKKIENINDK